MALIGLDIGTTGCKCTIFDIEGNVCPYATWNTALSAKAQDSMS